MLNKLPDTLQARIRDFILEPDVLVALRDAADFWLKTEEKKDSERASIINTWFLSNETFMQIGKKSPFYRALLLVEFMRCKQMYKKCPYAFECNVLNREKCRLVKERLDRREHTEVGVDK